MKKSTAFWLSVKSLLPDQVKKYPGKIQFLNLYIILFSLFLISCQKEMQNRSITNKPDGNMLKSVVMCEKPLIAAQNITAGTVTATFNAAGTQLTITYSTINTGYCLTETHLDVEADPANFPQASSGNPKVNQFAYGANLGYVTEWTQVVDLNTVSGWSLGDTVFIAANAHVKKIPGGTKEAWGQGVLFPGNNWAMYFCCKNDNIPEVTTATASDITPTSAICGGTITSDGGANVSERGVCWNKVQTPTITDSKTSDGTGSGNFTSTITGLTSNTTYYVRAYATNSAGTGYGAQISFTTPVTSSPWTVKASMPIANEYVGVVALNNKIYVIGGYNYGYLSSVEEYDPATNSWTTLPDMPSARNDAAAIVNNKIYVIGGNVTTVEEYNPAANTWITKSSMPTIRRPYVAVANNKIYAVGGYNVITGSLSTNEEYDPSSDTWVVKTNMPTARNGAPAAAANNMVYVFGGEYYPHTPYSIVEKYDPSTDTWTTKANMPTARRGAEAITLNNKIYVIGGHNSVYTDLATVEEYDPSTNTWATKTSMPTARSYLGLAVVNNKIYAIGGENSSITLMTVEEYDPLLDQ